MTPQSDSSRLQYCGSYQLCKTTAQVSGSMVMRLQAHDELSAGADWWLNVRAELVQQPSETNIIINKQESEALPGLLIRPSC